MSCPVFLTIAGSDSSAGAGIQADIKTGMALGCYALCAVTCVVSEVPGRVASISLVAPEVVASQIRECLRCFPVAAIKTGMLYSPEIMETVVAALPQGIPLVVDPVMVATAGTPLMLADSLRTYEQLLFPRASLITPNLDELSALTRRDLSPLTTDSLAAAARDLCSRYGCAVLAKGGHLPGDTCTDLLALPGEGDVRSFSHPRTTGISTHGTGCTLSAAITALLAAGLPLPQTVEKALNYTARAIAASYRWSDSLHATNH